MRSRDGTMTVGHGCFRDHRKYFGSFLIGGQVVVVF